MLGLNGKRQDCSGRVGIARSVMFLAVMALAMAGVFRMFKVHWPSWVTAVPGYTVGSLGAFWTIQRTVILLGLYR